MGCCVSTREDSKSVYTDGKVKVSPNNKDAKTPNALEQKKDSARSIEKKSTKLDVSGFEFVPSDDEQEPKELDRTKTPILDRNSSCSVQMSAKTMDLDQSDKEDMMTPPRVEKTKRISEP